jgi:hypothetical protein
MSNWMVFSNDVYDNELLQDVTSSVYKALLAMDATNVCISKRMHLHEVMYTICSIDTPHLSQSFRNLIEGYGAETLQKVASLAHTCLGATEYKNFTLYDLYFLTMLVKGKYSLYGGNKNHSTSAMKIWHAASFSLATHEDEPQYYKIVGTDPPLSLSSTLNYYINYDGCVGVEEYLMEIQAEIAENKTPTKKRWFSRRK